MKIAINKCYGGFGLSEKAYEFLGLEWDGYGYDFNDCSKRNDLKLIECIETLGSDKASGKYAKLNIVEIPDDVEFEIEEYDGFEWVAEKHRTWG
mgnify:FL=1